VLPPAIILAGGLGTRLRVAVPDLPKALAPVAGRPFIYWQLRWLEKQGVRRVILAVGYGAEAVRASVGDQFGDVSIQYSHETAPLGTGGALRQALALTTGREVLVLNGDTFVETSLAAMCAAHRASQARITVLIVAVPDVSRYGTVTAVDGRIREFHAAGQAGPGTINAGLYVLDPGLLQGNFPDQFSFERDILQSHLEELRPLAFCCGLNFIDIGTPDDFARAQALFPGAQPT
jgi:D-glycero-alpha-D-manno-heptose 1-phosphate guanylyltransferase